MNLQFYLVTSNPQLVRSNLDNWKVKRVGHGSHGIEDTRINSEIRSSFSRNRITVSMIYIPNRKPEVKHWLRLMLILLDGSSARSARRKPGTTRRIHMITRVASNGESGAKNAKYCACSLSKQTANGNKVLAEFFRYIDI